MNVSVSEELNRLNELREKGTLSQAQYERAKASVLSESTMFKREFTVRLYQADAAGVMFFGQYFMLVQETFESFLDTFCPLGEILASGAVLTPIAHVEADYKAPLRISDHVTIAMHLRSLSQRSFTLDYIFRKADETLAARVSIRYVAVASGTFTPCPIPDVLLAQLQDLPASKPL